VIAAGLAERAARLDRRRAAHRLILGALPLAIAQRFDPSAGGDLAATLELDIRDPDGGPPARFALMISDGRCTVRRGAAPAAVARALIGADDLIRLAGGVATWPELIAAGRFELSGDPFMALRFASLFRLPVRLDPA
jgi:hypothetical protein